VRWEKLRRALKKARFVRTAGKGKNDGVGINRLPLITWCFKKF